MADLRYGEKVVTIVADEKVNLRSLPELKPVTVLTQVAGGTQLRLLETREDWFKVGLPDGKEAWLSAVYGREDVARDLVRIKVPIARVRVERGTDSEMLTRLEEGTLLRPLEIVENWVKVRLPNDAEGWIRGDLLEVKRVDRSGSLELEDSSTHTLLLLASVGSGVSAFSFVLVMTIVMRRKNQQSVPPHFGGGRSAYYGS